MDGNKKIIHLSLWLILIFGSTACNMQKPTYVSLYVDDINYTQDSVIVEDKIAVDKKKETFTIDTLMSFKFKDVKNSPDSLNRTTSLELLKNISDSINTLNMKLDSVLKVKNVKINNIIVNKGVSSHLDSLLDKKDSLKHNKNQSQYKTITKKDTVYITDTVFIDKDISKIESENIEILKKQINTKNDTILMLKKQINNVPKINTKTDTVFIDKDISKTDSENVEILKKQINTKNDTILMLKKQLNNVPKINTKTDIGFTENTVNQIADTMLIVAYYTIGKTIPNSNIFSKIVNILQENNVQKIEISGFTDSSGNTYINKKITDIRINYIISKISPVISISKIYYQNFADTLASKNIVEEERRLEIKIYYIIK